MLLSTQFKLKLIVFSFIITSVTLAKAAVTYESTQTGVYTVTVNAAGELATALTSDPLKSATTLIIKTKDGVSLNTDDLNALFINEPSLVTSGTLKSLNLTDAKCTYPETWDHKTNWDACLGNKNLQYLENLTYPKNMVYIPKLEGGSVKKLKKITIPRKDKDDKTKYILAESCFQGVENLEYLEIDNCVDEIPANFCMNLAKLKDVFLNDSIKKIGDDAFKECKSLKNLSLPEGITEIGSAAFLNCAITAIRIPSTLKTIGSGAFRDCHYLEEIVIPENVDSIGSDAFLSCNSLKDVYIKNASTRICKDSFDPLLMCRNIQTLPTDGTVNRESYWKQGDNFNINSNNGQSLLHIYNNTNSANQSLIAEYNARYSNEKEINSTKIYTVQNTTTGAYWPSQSDGNILDNNISYSGANAGNWQRFALATTYSSTDEWSVPTVVNDTWYTICVPFDVTKSQIQTAFGASTEVCKFVGVRTVTIGGKTTLDIDFTTDIMPTDAAGSTTIIEKGKAYMIHPSTHTGDYGTSGIFTITGVTADASCSPIAIPGATSDGYVSGYSFVGTFTDGTLSSHAGSYFLACKTTEKYPQFYRATAISGTWTANTAIVTPPTGGSGSAKSMTIYLGSEGLDFDHMIIGGDASSTDINEIRANSIVTVNADNKVYNMQGVYVGNSLDGLNSGMYIVNGKKYMVR